MGHPPRVRLCIRGGAGARTALTDLQRLLESRHAARWLRGGNRLSAYRNLLVRAREYTRFRGAVGALVVPPPARGDRGGSGDRVVGRAEPDHLTAQEPRGPRVGQRSAAEPAQTAASSPDRQRDPGLLLRASSIDVAATLTPLDPRGKPAAPPPRCGRRRAAARSQSARAIAPPTRIARALRRQLTGASRPFGGSPTPAPSSGTEVSKLVLISGASPRGCAGGERRSAGDRRVARSPRSGWGRRRPRPGVRRRGPGRSDRGRARASTR
jgi:hypothetical protein